MTAMEVVEMHPGMPHNGGIFQFVAADYVNINLLRHQPGQQSQLIMQRAPRGQRGFYLDRHRIQGVTILKLVGG